MLLSADDLWPQPRNQLLSYSGPDPCTSHAGSMHIPCKPHADPLQVPHLSHLRLLSFGAYASVCAAQRCPVYIDMWGAG